MILAAALLLAEPAIPLGIDPPRKEQSLANGSVLDAVRRLPPGGYLWMPQAAPSGPMLLIVNIRTQRAVLYRNGVPIGITTVSTGREGHETPLGVFTILQKQVEHFSNLYDDAPMPFMQRLTWGGVALHGGHLPGYPASHGCIRLPEPFAKLLFAETPLGMTVLVADQPLAPAFAPGVEPLLGATTDAPYSWTPGNAPDGPMSILISGADQRVVILRNGQLIGWAVLRIDGKIDRPYLFSLQAISGDGHRTWSQLPLPGQDANDGRLAGPPQIHVAAEFQRLVSAVMPPGTTVILTPDSLHPEAGNSRLLESEGPASK